MYVVVVVRAGVSVKDCRPIGIIGRQLRDNQPNHDDDDDKGPLHKKKCGIIWEFFPSVGPPPPYLGGLCPKKSKGLFCVLGPKEHFWFLQKKNHFLSVFLHIHLGRGLYYLKKFSFL